jgi:CubicO group peptidase (beta-lactamase class C family)
MKVGIKKHRHRAAFAMFLLAAFPGIAQQPEAQMVFPGATWAGRTPESLGVDPAVLASAIEYFHENGGGVGSDEMVVIRNGYVIWQGPAANNKHRLHSVTKTFTTTVMGVLEKKGLLHHDDPAVDHFPGLIEGDDGQEAYAPVRLRDLATMTAGYAAVVTNCWQLFEQGRFDESYDCTLQYIIPGKPEYTPRTQLSYRDPNVHMLGYILTRVAGRSLEDVFRDEVADKIGMMDWEWSYYNDVDGIRFNNPAGTPRDYEATTLNEAQSGIWTTPLELARFGLLYLNRGNWNGEQILDADYVDTAISNQVEPSIPSRPALAGRYGFYFWTNGVRADGTRPWPSAPPRATTPHGGGRNFCFVLPEWNMVVVRMSPTTHSPMGNTREDVWEGFFKILKDGVK